MREAAHDVTIPGTNFSEGPALHNRCEKICNHKGAAYRVFIHCAKAGYLATKRCGRRCIGRPRLIRVDVISGNCGERHDIFKPAATRLVRARARGVVAAAAVAAAAGVGGARSKFFCSHFPDD